MPNIYSKVQNGDLRLSQLTENQYNRYLRQKERAGESHDYMKNFNLATIPGAVNNVFTGTTTVGDGYIWDAPTTGQEDGWKIASNVLGLGDSLYELAHPAYSDPSVQNYINQNKGIIDTIGANVNAGIGATSTSGLMDLISNSNYASTDYDLDQLGNDNNVGKTIGGIGKAMLKGAESGSIGGPWGALGGAATGLITGIGAAFSGAKNKKADAINLQNQLKTRAAIANNRQSAAFQLGNSNIQSNNIRNQLMNNYNANSYGFAAYGGKLYPFGGALAGYGGDWTNGLNFINNGGTHEENPYEGVPVSIAQDGQPNLVEEGEVVWNDYVFSNRLEVPKEVMDQLKLGKGKKTFAEVVEKVQKEAAERPNDPIAKRGLEDSLQKLAAIQEQVRAEQEQQDAYNQAEDTAAMYADGGPIHIAKNKRGTFTAAATKNGMGVQEFAKHVLANKDKYSTNMVRKAVFAHNANSWEHCYGGYLFGPGGPLSSTVQSKANSYLDNNGNNILSEMSYIDNSNGDRNFLYQTNNNGNSQTFYSNLGNGVNGISVGNDYIPMTTEQALDYRRSIGDISILPTATVSASYNPKYALGGHIAAKGMLFTTTNPPVRVIDPITPDVGRGTYISNTGQRPLWPNNGNIYESLADANYQNWINNGGEQRFDEAQKSVPLGFIPGVSSLPDYPIAGNAYEQRANWDYYAKRKADEQLQKEAREASLQQFKNAALGIPASAVIGQNNTSNAAIPVVTSGSNIMPATTKQSSVAGNSRVNTSSNYGTLDRNKAKWVVDHLPTKEYQDLLKEQAPQLYDRFKDNPQGFYDYAFTGRPGTAYRTLKGVVDGIDWNKVNMNSTTTTSSSETSATSNYLTNPESVPDVTMPSLEEQEDFYRALGLTDDENPAVASTPPKTPKTKGKTKFDESWLRYAPVLGSAIGAIASLFDKPDMEYANAIERAGREAAGKLKDVKAKPIGDYLAYNPFDRLFYANQLGAQAAAQRRAIENAASGNIGAAMAGLTSAGYNADVALGQLYRQGEEYNLAQRQKVADFNRGTNMFNSQEDLRAQMANAQTAAQRASIIQNALTQAAALKLGEKNRIQEARSLNLTNFFDNLGNIGWEAVNRNMINSNRALYYYMQANGISNYKGATEDQKDEIAAMLGKSRKETDKIGAQYDRENKNS